MEQGHFDWNEQRENLERVSTRIAAAVLEFLTDRLGQDRRFHAEELRNFVIRKTGIAAPASADRILRDLRQRGLIEYRVLSRRESLYEIAAVKGQEKATAQEAK